jgi:myo-inositol-1(or 4)-monophosphatase
MQSTRNGEPCAVSAIDSLDGAAVATGFPGVRTDADFEAFLAVKKRVQAVRRCGAAAIDMCLVADGTYEAYFERKLNPWDFAAASAIVLGAGGRLSSPTGGPADLFAGALVATNGKVHDDLLAVLAPTDFAKSYRASAST